MPVVRIRGTARKPQQVFPRHLFLGGFRLYNVCYFYDAVYGQGRVRFEESLVCWGAKPFGKKGNEVTKEVPRTQYLIY